MNEAHCTSFLQSRLIDCGHILYVYSQSGQAVVNYLDVVLATKTLDDLKCLCKLFVADRCSASSLGLFLGIFICNIDRQILLCQISLEYQVVSDEEERSYNHDPVPVRPRLENAPDEKVDQTTTSITNDNLECCHQHEGNTTHDCMENKQWRCYKHEGELHRLSNSGYYAGCNACDHQRLYTCLLLCRCGAIDCKCCTRKTKHHHRHLALSKEYGERLKLRQIYLIYELKEDV